MGRAGGLGDPRVERGLTELNCGAARSIPDLMYQSPPLTRRKHHKFSPRRLRFDTRPPMLVGGHYGCSVHRRTALKLPLLLAAGAALSHVPCASAEAPRWTAERANTWYQAQGWLVGANYIPATAVNQIEMFQQGTYNPQRIDAELRLARVIGFNTVRVFLHDLLWVQDRRGFQQRLAQFVAIAASHGIKPLFVFFDSCWNPYPKLGPQPAPVSGVHSPGWVQSPGAERLGDPRYLSVMRDYVVGVITQFGGDDRVLGWDLWNEPDNPAAEYHKVERSDKVQLVTALLPQVFQWARSVNPSQPLTSAVWHGNWGDPGQRSAICSLQLDNSDVITFHNYGKPAEFEGRIAELAPLGRPIICTEYLARTLGSTVEGILPVAKRHNVGAYNWGLVAGRTETYFPWDSWDDPYTAPPKLWFHDLLRPDGHAYRNSEVQAIQQLTGAQGSA